MVHDILIALGFAGLEVILVLLICRRVEIMAKRKMLTPKQTDNRLVTTVPIPEVISDHG